VLFPTLFGWHTVVHWQSQPESPWLALAKPLSASIFLMVNGVILLSAERYRRRADVRQLAAREGENAQGGRRLESLEFREAGLIGVAQSSALIAGISRDGVCMTAGLVRGLNHEDSARFAFLLATPIILAAGIFKLPHPPRPARRRHPPASSRRRRVCSGRRLRLRRLPRALVQDEDTLAVRHLLRLVRTGHGYLPPVLSTGQRV
jgi:hypothetical protein